MRFFWRMSEYFKCKYLSGVVWCPQVEILNSCAAESLKYEHIRDGGADLGSIKNQGLCPNCPHDALKSQNLYPENSPSTEELWDKNQCQRMQEQAVCAITGQPRATGAFKGCSSLDDPIVPSPLGRCRD